MKGIEDLLAHGWPQHDKQPDQVAAAIEGLTMSDVRAGELGNIFKLYFHVQFAHRQDTVALQGFLNRHADGGENAEVAYQAQKHTTLLRICQGEDVGDLAELTALQPAAPNVAAELYARAAGEVAHSAPSDQAIALLNRAVYALKPGANKDDPAVRALAIAANNLAGAYEGLAELSASQTNHMIQCAQRAREYWGICGTAVNAERAEYRLAMCYLKAEDFANALKHGRECEAICANQELDGVERFYASAVLAQIHVAQCLAIKDRLPSEQQQYCHLPAMPANDKT